MNNFTIKITHIGNLINTINSRISLSHMKEGNFIMHGISGGFSLNKHTIIFEIDQAKNWINDYTSIAFFNEYSWEYIQGIHFVAKYDFFDPKINFQDGAINRYTLGIDFFPLNIMEVKLQSRISKVEKQLDPEFLIQTHFYF